MRKLLSSAQEGVQCIEQTAEEPTRSRISINQKDVRVELETQVA